MDTYSIEVFVESKKKKFGFKLCGYDYNHLKDTFLQELRCQCRLEKVSGEIYVDVTVEKNGDYFDHDEFTAILSDDFKNLEVEI